MNRILRSSRALVATALTAVVVAHTSAAQAADPGAKPSPVHAFLDDGQRWLTAALAGPTAASSTRPAEAVTATGERTGDTDQARRPAFDLAPQVSIVARDWRGSMKIAGSRTLILDDVRPTASNRMVMLRVATDGKVSGFAQLGAGQWRIDTVMFPNARGTSEYAGQLGAGFEVRLARSLRVGTEVQYTFLVERSLTYTTEEVAPRMVSGLLAMKGTF